jgi:L-alanine-DL-glutamate epimerase-like enolase superfamily enzyme
VTTVAPIASVEASLVRLPLGRPLRFESGSWSHWYYAVARVTTADGAVGTAYTHIGEVPVDVMVTGLVAPELVDREVGDLEGVAERCARLASPPLADIVRPAASLVEVCLWDIAAQAARVPLWRLLAPEPACPEIPVMIVEHRRDDDTPEAFAARVAEHAARGASAVKIKHYGDAADTAARLAAIRTATGPALELVVDVGWAWTDVESAVTLARAWEGHGLAWIEDPFPPERVDDAVRLRAAIDAPIGIGDGVSSIDLARRLVERGAVDVHRVDVTTMGGIAGVARLVSAAGDAGVRVSPEIFAEVHQHLAAAWPAVVGVEVYSTESRVWAADEFVRPGALRVSESGALVLPDAPGSGLAIDWDAVERHALRSSRYPDS